MRYSELLLPTQKETPADAQVVSHALLMRAGFMRKLAAGVYSFLPLGLRVVKRIETIVRQEMDRAGAQEVLLPVTLPAELWQESGRWEKYGPELLRFKDRKGADFVIGPTHEEGIVDLVRRDVRSYRQLPMNLYQIQVKFRDEVRPRAGLLRGREFIMKDAYSFHTDEASAFKEYDRMYATYRRIFDRCGLRYRAVEADTGAIGGSRSHEFQVLADSGEDAIVACNTCDYAANVEKAELKRIAANEAVAAPSAALEKVATPGKKTIEEVAEFLKVRPEQTVKTMVYLVDNKPVMALVRGDRDVNELKLKSALGGDQVVLPTEQVIAETVKRPVGYLGPIGVDVPVYADLEVAALAGFVTGANEVDHHVKNVLLGRDFQATVLDLRRAAAGDPCARCGKGIYAGYKGIEVGQVFFLGTKYSAPMKAVVLDQAGTEVPMVMGCYGIGITRTLAASIEQNNDADGIIWPMALAPFHVTVLPLQDDPQIKEAADTLVRDLEARGLEVLVDDREERPGVKFKDADLVGIPLRIAIGKKTLAQGKVELKPRRDKDVQLLSIGEAAAKVAELVARELGAGQPKA